MISFRIYYLYLADYLADDETGSFLWFSAQGYLLTLFHYPEPNNHVFYNLCSIWWLNWPIPRMLAIRMTSLLSFETEQYTMVL